MEKASTQQRAPRTRSPKGTTGGRVYVPLTVDERRHLDEMAAQEERGSSAMARQIYLMGLKAIQESLAIRARAPL